MLTVLGCALLWAVSADAQKETVIKSNENGEITLTEPVKVGNMTLQPDTYVLQHRDSHGQDFIRFMRVEKSRELRLDRAYTGWYTKTELVKVGEIKCRMERLGAKAQASMVKLTAEGGVPRIAEAMIKGKGAVYLF